MPALAETVTLLVLSFGAWERSKAKHLFHVFKICCWIRGPFGADVSRSKVDLCNELPSLTAVLCLSLLLGKAWAVLLARLSYLLKILFCKLSYCGQKFVFYNCGASHPCPSEVTARFLDTQDPLSGHVACFILKGKWEFSSFSYPLWLLERSWEIQNICVIVSLLILRAINQTFQARGPQQFDAAWCSGPLFKACLGDTNQFRSVPQFQHCAPAFLFLLWTSLGSFCSPFCVHFSCSEDTWSCQISEYASEYRVVQSSHHKLHAVAPDRTLCPREAVGQLESPAFSAWVMMLVLVAAFPTLLNYCTDRVSSKNSSVLWLWRVALWGCRMRFVSDSPLVRSFTLDLIA